MKLENLVYMRNQICHSKPFYHEIIVDNKGEIQNELEYNYSENRFVKNFGFYEDLLEVFVLLDTILDKLSLVSTELLNWKVNNRFSPLLHE